MSILLHISEIDTNIEKEYKNGLKIPQTSQGDPFLIDSIYYVLSDKTGHKKTPIKGFDRQGKRWAILALSLARIFRILRRVTNIVLSTSFGLISLLETPRS